MNTLQVTVGSTEGIDVMSLVRVIAQHYRTADGRCVEVTIGQGAALDGLPAGLIYLEAV